MKQKWIIGMALVLMLAVVYLIARDLFTDQKVEDTSLADYDIEGLKKIDSTLLGYQEIKPLVLKIKNTSALALDENSNLYVSGDGGITIYDSLLNQKSFVKTDTVATCMAVMNKKIIAGFGGHLEIIPLEGGKKKTCQAFSPKSYLTSVATDGKEIFVADAGARLVFRCDMDGQLINTIGKKDKAKGIDGFILPSLYFDLAIGPDQELWVVNPGKHELVNFTAKGDYRTAWGVPSMQANGFAGCCNPTHFSFLPDGKYVTCEKGIDRIKVHDATGKFECYVALFPDANIKTLNDGHTGARIHDVVAGKTGKIYVLDGKLNQVRIFIKK